MAKPKDTVQKIADVDVKLTESAEQPAKTVAPFGRELAVSKFKRDADGLLVNTTYKFKDDGSVDWKAMIPAEYVVVNTEYFQKKNIDVPTSTEGLADKQLLILLAGFKELLKLRGSEVVEKKVVESSYERAVVECKLVLTENYETKAGMPQVFTEVANATLVNTNSSSQLFLETIASNRAFVRAVRNALRIDIVGQDEMSSVEYKQDDEVSGQAEAWMALATLARNTPTKKFPEGFKTFEDFKSILLERKLEGAEGWQDWKDIPGGVVLKLMGQLNKVKST